MSPSKKIDRSWPKTDAARADAFAEHQTEVSTSLQLDINNSDGVIKGFLDILCQMSLPTAPFSPTKVVQEVTNTNQHKALDYDLITGKILR